MARRSFHRLLQLLLSRLARVISPADGPGFLYAFVDGGVLWKIGMTKDFHRRRAEWDNQCPFPGRIWMAPVPTMTRRRAESIAHLALEDSCLDRPRLWCNNCLDDDNLPSPRDCCCSLDVKLCFVHRARPASSGLVVLRVALLVLVVLAVCGFWGGLVVIAGTTFQVSMWASSNGNKIIAEFHNETNKYYAYRWDVSLYWCRRQEFEPHSIQGIRTLAFCQVGQYSGKQYLSDALPLSH
ncbi:hypothetical protein GG344DRAFT_71031 [Lentinula edodes]|nr:hypothetical protein GG344DRAFT_71031 [Lentinula edodes]